MNHFKKIIAGAMSAFLIFGAAGCSSSTTPDTGDKENTTDKSSQVVLQEIWDKDTDENKPTIIGGMGEDTIEDGVEALEISDGEGILNSYAIPKDVSAAALNGAGIMNAMMANNFTASVLQMDTTADVKVDADAVIKGLKENHWMCGIPEEYAVATSGNYIITVFGLSDTLKPFLDAAKEVLPDLEIVAQAPVE